MPSVPTTYKAYVYEKYGKPAEVIKLAQVPTGALAADKVRIKIHSASLNPVDIKLIDCDVDGFVGEYLTGTKPSTEKPYRLGCDGAGVVAQLGDAVTNCKVGDEVYWECDIPNVGTMAEYFDIEAAFLALKPKNLDFLQAASVPVAGLTSYQAIFQHGNVQAGQRVLLLGGSSSCGIFAIQFAKAVGAYVVATTSAKNSEFVKSIGADQAIDYHTEKWGDVLEKHSVDLIYDCGFDTASWNTDAQVVLKHGGRYVALGQIPNAIESPIGATQLMMGVRPNGDHLTKIADLIEAGKVKPVVDTVVSFDKLLDGIARVQTGHTVGKVVVKII